MYSTLEIPKIKDPKFGQGNKVKSDARKNVKKWKYSLTKWASTKEKTKWC